MIPTNAGKGNVRTILGEVGEGLKDIHRRGAVRPELVDEQTRHTDNNSKI